jgi:hypothetical protein
VRIAGGNRAKKALRTCRFQAVKSAEISPETVPLHPFGEGGFGQTGRTVDFDFKYCLSSCFAGFLIVLRGVNQ